jgi:hypothetical protein
MDAREERDDSIAPPDPRLLDAWQLYRKNFSGHAFLPHDDVRSWHHFDALALLAPIAADKQAIDRFILCAEDRDHRLFGLFAGVAYQLLPEKRLVYCLDTPEIENFGHFLHGKHLIVDGALGKDTAFAMTGILTVNGTLGWRSCLHLFGSIETQRHFADGYYLQESVDGLPSVVPLLGTFSVAGETQYRIVSPEDEMEFRAMLLADMPVAPDRRIDRYCPPGDPLRQRITQRYTQRIRENPLFQKNRDFAWYLG